MFLKGSGKPSDAGPQSPSSKNSLFGTSVSFFPIGSMKDIINFFDKDGVFLLS